MSMCKMEGLDTNDFIENGMIIWSEMTSDP